MNLYSNQDENYHSNYDSILGPINVFLSTQNTNNVSPNKVNRWNRRQLIDKEVFKGVTFTRCTYVT
jgi:hypothetical protein